MRKTCSRCKNEKDYSEFYDDKRKKSGKTSECKICKNLAGKVFTKNWRIANPEIANLSNKKTKVKQKYNALYDDILLALEKQNGKCDICGVEISFKANCKNDKPHIDHDHETGYVRGLLCLTCNSGLGMFKDSTEFLALAIIYLQRAKDVQRERLSELAPEKG